MPNWTAVNHFQLFISKNREIPTHVYTKRLLLICSRIQQQYKTLDDKFSGSHHSGMAVVHAVVSSTVVLVGLALDLVD